MTFARFACVGFAAAALTAAAAAAAVPAGAQQSPTAAAPAGGKMPASTDNPLLAVATVKLVGGTSLKKLMGASVVTDSNQPIGTVDDLILSAGDTPSVAVLQVGGFLGVGGKLVAVNYNELKFGDDGKIMFPGASKQSLAALPGFEYGK